MPGDPTCSAITSVKGFSLAERERKAVADKVTWKLREMHPHAVPPLMPLPEHASVAPGVLVLSVLEVAEILGKSERHLVRLERMGEIPSRRRISRRRAGYLAHELQGLRAGRVMARGPRTLSRKQVAEKLGMNEKTVSRMVRDAEMPPPVEGRWLERALDAWLLLRPRVCG